MQLSRPLSSNVESPIPRSDSRGPKRVSEWIKWTISWDGKRVVSMENVGPQKLFCLISVTALFPNILDEHAWENVSRTYQKKAWNISFFITLISKPKFIHE